MFERLWIIIHFVRARWLRRFDSREKLVYWQRNQLDRFLKELVETCPYHRGFPPKLSELPILGKATYRSHFRELNSLGIELNVAEEVALRAETERDFSAKIGQDLTVGLSSGTSGRRGVFLVSSADRVRWAGMILARALSSESLWQIANPMRPRLKIAFFLRANSNLYQTIDSRRIDFSYYDLLEGLPILSERLQSFQPDVLIAPATVLAELAKQDSLSISPRQVISVAEVLDERDAEAIERKWSVVPSQIYQATEGFIASTCAEGSIHLNEEYLHVEREWLDESKTRFHPIITDFSRRSQSFVRYRLDDVLIAEDAECRCGRVSRVIRTIEGRSDEILWFPTAIFPDVIRQALYSVPIVLDLYRMEQHGNELHLFLRDSSQSAVVAHALDAMFRRLGLATPVIRFLEWIPQPMEEKQRRIRCVTRLNYST